MGAIERFHRGNRIPEKPERAEKMEANESPISHEAREALFELYRSIEDKKRGAWLMFDVDGVLVHAGLGDTPTSYDPIERYFEENVRAVERFRKEVSSLKKLGFKIAVNTGRGAESAQHIIKLLFPDRSVDAMVCEGGALIVENLRDRSIHESEHIREARGVSRDSLNELNKVRNEIISYARELGGKVVPARKDVILSLNPPPAGDIENFRNRINAWVTEHVEPDLLEINNSKTSVDISPKGVDKLAALKEVVGNDIVAYFGDAPGDEKAMRGSAINITPGNAFESTKAVARKAQFGLVVPEQGTGHDELVGVVGALKNIRMYVRFARRHGKESKETESV